MVVRDAYLWLRSSLWSAKVQQRAGGREASSASRFVKCEMVRSQRTIRRVDGRVVGWVLGWMKGLDVSRVGVVLGMDELSKRQAWAVRKGGRAPLPP